MIRPGRRTTRCRRTGAEKFAALTIATLEVTADQARQFGMLEAAENGRITRFQEKPAAGQASAGVYIFDTAFLLERLDEDARRAESAHDFGRDLIPAIVEAGLAYAYPLAGRWAGFGTVESYWQGNLALLGQEPIVDLGDPGWPIRTRAGQDRPAVLRAGGQASDSLVSAGWVIEGEVTHSVLSPGVRVERGALVRDSVILSNSVIRAGAGVSSCVIAEAVEVGAAAFLGAGGDLTPNEGEPELLASGLTLVGQGARIPAGLVIGRNCLVEPGAGEKDFAGAGMYIPGGKTVRKG